MATPLHNANGHRRRQLVRRVWAEENSCALCGLPIDKTLKNLPGVHSKRCPRVECPGCVPDPMRGEVDEDMPRSRGGSPYARKNCHLMHRSCNQYKSNMTIEEAKNKRASQDGPRSPALRPSPGW